MTTTGENAIDAVPDMLFSTSQDQHRIVYIEYFDGIPHSIITDSRKADESFDGFMDHWDCDVDARFGGFMYYNSGSGGRITEIQQLHVVEGSDCEYWMHKEANMRGEAINATRINQPKLLTNKYGESSINYMEVAEQVFAVCHCRDCNGYIGDSWCDQHMYEDNRTGEYELYYLSDDSRVED